MPMPAPSLPPLPPPTHVAAGGVLIRNDHVLVNRAAYLERFTIPGGCVHRGETREVALIREVKEESGVTRRVGRLLLARHEVGNAGQSGVYFAFPLAHVTAEPTARPRGDRGVT